MDATDTLSFRDRSGATDGADDVRPQELTGAGAKGFGPEGAVPSADDFSHAGEMLAAARQSLGLSLDEVSARINVKAERLGAIETLDKSSLPAPTFTLGFVRSYARTLGLPEDALVERFRRDAGYPQPQTAPVIEPKLQKDLGASPQVSLFSVLTIIVIVLWGLWQLLQASVPDEVAVSEDATRGIPLVERARSATGVTYELEASIADASAEPAPAADQSVAEVTDAVVLPITPEELERVLAEGEEEARTASLARDQAATEEAAERLAADGGADGTEEIAEGEATETAPAAPEVSEADRLNAEALNRLALEAVRGSEADAAPAEETATTVAEAEVVEPEAPVEASADTVTAEPAAMVEAETTIDGIEIVTAGPDAPEETVVELSAIDGRVPATIRAAVEPVYPPRCESAAAETETVTVRYTVSRFGKVVNPEAVASSNSCFNRAAVAAVARWDFFPAEENGQAATDSDRTSRIVFQRP